KFVNGRVATMEMRQVRGIGEPECGLGWSATTRGFDAVGRKDFGQGALGLRPGLVCIMARCRLLPGQITESCCHDRRADRCGEQEQYRTSDEAGNGLITPTPPTESFDTARRPGGDGLILKKMSQVSGHLPGGLIAVGRISGDCLENNCFQIPRHV